MVRYVAAVVVSFFFVVMPWRHLDTDRYLFLLEMYRYDSTNRPMGSMGVFALVLFTRIVRHVKWRCLRLTTNFINMYMIPVLICGMGITRGYHLASCLLYPTIFNDPERRDKIQCILNKGTQWNLHRWQKKSGNKTWCYYCAISLEELWFLPLHALYIYVLTNHK